VHRATFYPFANFAISGIGIDPRTPKLNIPAWNWSEVKMRRYLTYDELPPHDFRKSLQYKRFRVPLGLDSDLSRRPQPAAGRGAQLQLRGLGVGDGFEPSQ
jgi:hypothetical protein